MNIGISSTATNTKVSNVDIDIDKATIQANACYGVRLYGDNFMLDKARINADSGFSVGKTIGTGACKNIKLSNVTFELIGTTAVSAIIFPEGLEGFENFTLDNVTIIRESSTASKAIDINQSTTTLKNLVINKLTLIDNHAEPNIHYGIEGQRLVGLSIDGFNHINKGTGTVYRSIKLKDSSKFRVKNCDLTLSGGISMEFTNCVDLSFSDIVGTSGFLVALNNSNAILGNVPTNKVYFIDTVSRNKGSFTAPFSVGTTAERPSYAKKGHYHFDATLSKPVWCKTEAIVDGTGVITTAAVWIDSANTTV
jgi:hypothetical protein